MDVDDDQLLVLSTRTMNALCKSPFGFRQTDSRAAVRTRMATLIADGTWIDVRKSLLMIKNMGRHSMDELFEWLGPEPLLPSNQQKTVSDVTMAELAGLRSALVTILADVDSMLARLARLRRTPTNGSGNG